MELACRGEKIEKFLRAFFKFIQPTTGKSTYLKFKKKHFLPKRRAVLISNFTVNFIKKFNRYY